ncbi:MAG: 4Fe-4S binding protein [Syntrophaceae bacterium]|nr:4Fe-4S binding protein [Syntrophaceae bacterium]
MISISDDQPGAVALLMGNEAIARGVLEAGAKVAAAYPGTPSSEIIDRLSKVAKKFDIYVEWSINEKVAMEVAAAASLAGVRAISAMKQNGLNVMLDFLSNVVYTGVKSGLVLVVGDDPGGLSSSNEQDSRNVAKNLDFPLLEPATFQEAKDMTKWAFDVSEEFRNVCMVRGVTRIMHARGNVVLGELPNANPRAWYDTSKIYAPPPGAVMGSHIRLHENLERLRELFETSRYNWYLGPEKPGLLIITSGTGWVYSKEAVELLSVGQRVGILKLGTTWPLPTKLVTKHLLQTENVLIVEEVDAFIETNVKEISADLIPGRKWRFFGKASGHMNPYGENSVDLVVKAVAKSLGISGGNREADFIRIDDEMFRRFAPPRALQFCAGCPHRATYWAIKNALCLDGRDGVVTGDIGCYSLGQMASGFGQMKTSHAMGSGVGLASGLGKLNQFGFDQPVLTVCGDSTFFHASIPALIDGVHKQSDFILLVLDNSGTAMTGFQPHAGIEKNAIGDTVPKINIESICRALNIPVTSIDPYDVKDTTKKLLDELDALKQGTGPRVIICKRECALIRASRTGPIFKVWVDQERCLGNECGCGRFCTRIFRCPGLIWNQDLNKSEIDEAICSGCGVCVDICPQSAIVREATAVYEK